jgi:MYXO-CTERM domain-containing protein
MHEYCGKWRRVVNSVLIMASVGVAASPAAAQLRVVSWNTATSQTGGFSARQTHFNRVLDYMGREPVNGISRPIDVLILQEQRQDSGSLTDFADELNAITGTSDYAAWSETPYNTDGYQVGFVYNSATVSVQHEDWYRTETGRSTARIALRPAGYGTEADLWVYNSHYKAGSDSGDQTRRRDAALDVRMQFSEGQTGSGDSGLRFGSDHLDADANILYAGDYNQKNSFEDANNLYAWLENPYEIMRLSTELGTSGNGQAVDVLNRPGYWYNNSSFADIHTQSPHDGSYGLVTGGMDDRFDHIMVSTELNDGEGLAYIGPDSGDSPATEESYHTFGNNGTSFNQAANSSGNTGLDWIMSELGEPAATRNAVRDSLAKASDHSPVVADYQLPSVLDASSEPTGLVGGKVRQGRTAEVEVTVSNGATVSVALGADELDYDGPGSGELSGSFSDTAPALGGWNSHVLTMDTSSVGAHSGTVSVTATSQAAANANYSEQVNYDVTWLGDVDTDGDETADDIDAADIDLCYDRFGTSDMFADLDDSGPVGQPGGAELVETILGTEYGDADLDGDVDLSDLGMMLGGYGSTSGMGWADGDLDGDAQIGLSDLGKLLGNYGYTGGMAGPPADAPEPAAVVLLGLGGVALVRRRRSAAA